MSEAATSTVNEPRAVGDLAVAELPDEHRDLRHARVGDPMTLID